jgi:flagellar biosynthetic protein FliR
VLLQESYIFSYIIILVRVAAFISSFPGFGDKSTPAQIKIAFSIAISFYIANISDIPIYEKISILSLTLICMKEMLIGLVMGLSCKLMFIAVNIFGSILSMQFGLSAAAFFDPNQGTSSSIFVTFITNYATVLMFFHDVHHMAILSIIKSYQNLNFDIEQIGEFCASLISSSFKIGVISAAPFIAVNIIVNIAGGVMSRLMPSFQIFFLITPINIMILYILFLSFFDDILINILGGLKETISIFL